MAQDETRENEGPLERPLLAPWLRRATSEGRLVLEYGDEIVVLGGAGAAALLEGMLPLLDGTRTVADTAAETVLPPVPSVATAVKVYVPAGTECHVKT